MQPNYRSLVVVALVAPFAFVPALAEGPSASALPAGVEAPPFEILEELASRADQATPADLLRASGALAPDATFVDAQLSHTAYPVGDVSGDGLDDVLDVTVDPSGSMALRALRGLDGEELWTIDPGAPAGLLFLPTDDLTSDGRDDLLLLTLDVGEAVGDAACAPGAGTCVFAFAANATWRLALLSGADGAPAWERTSPVLVEDVSRFGWAPVASSGTAVSSAVKAAVVPTLVADRDGDGASDLIVEERTVLFLHEREDTLATRAAAGTHLFVNEAHLVDGASGEGTPARASAVAYGDSGLLAAGDAVGDADEDFLWWTFTEVSSPSAACVIPPGSAVCAPDPGTRSWRVQLEMVDGATLRTAWTTSRSLSSSMDSAFVATLAEDATGDGRPDAYVREMERFSVTPPRLTLVSGADGEEPWSASAFSAFAIGSIDGGAGSDLALPVHAPDEGGVLVTVPRVDGASGKLLLTTERYVGFPGGFGSVDVLVRPLGEVDGDGVADILFGTTMRAETAASNWTVESGATGGILFASDTPTLAHAYPAGDIDADDVPDLYLLTFEGDFQQGTFTLQGIPLATGTPAWTRNDTLVGSSPQAIVAAGGDLSGDGGDDLVYDLFAGFGEEAVSRVHVLEGPTGAQMWTLGP